MPFCRTLSFLVQLVQSVFKATVSCLVERRPLEKPSTNTTPIAAGFLPILDRTILPLRSISQDSSQTPLLLTSIGSFLPTGRRSHTSPSMTASYRNGTGRATSACLRSHSLPSAVAPSPSTAPISCSIPSSTLRGSLTLGIASLSLRLSVDAASLSARHPCETSSPARKSFLVKSIKLMRRFTTTSPKPLMHFTRVSGPVQWGRLRILQLLLILQRVCLAFRGSEWSMLLYSPLASMDSLWEQYVSLLYMMQFSMRGSPIANDSHRCSCGENCGRDFGRAGVMMRSWEFGEPVCEEAVLP